MTNPATLVAMTADAFSEQVVRISRENAELRAKAEEREALIKELTAENAALRGEPSESDSGTP